MNKEWYWVVVSGAGASGPIPWPSAEPPGAYPPPEQCLGFDTFKEARRVAHMLVHAPMAQVQKYMSETFPAMLKAGQVAYQRCKKGDIS
jgi:hypothetical protein